MIIQPDQVKFLKKQNKRYLLIFLNTHILHHEENIFRLYLATKLMCNQLLQSSLNLKSSKEMKL